MVQPRELSGGNSGQKVVMPALVAGIHVFSLQAKRGWPGQAGHDAGTLSALRIVLKPLPDFSISIDG
jgi:hypothetical protein